MDISLAVISGPARAMHRIIKSGRLNLTTGSTGSLFTFGISSRRSRDDRPARAAATSGGRGPFLPPGRLHRGATNGATRRRCSVARPVTPRVALCTRAIRIALWSSASRWSRADRADGTACLEETRPCSTCRARRQRTFPVDGCDLPPLLFPPTSILASDNRPNSSSFSSSQDRPTQDASPSDRHVFRVIRGEPSDVNGR